MTSTSATDSQSLSGSAPTSAFDTLSSSLLLSLPPLPSQLNPHAAPIFFPSVISPASVTPALSVAPPLLPYASQQSTVYFPGLSPPPLSVGSLDGGWRPVPSSVYYPTHPPARQMSVVRQSLRSDWDPRLFDYSGGSVSGLGGGLPSLPYSGYPAFEHRSAGRQPSISASNRQMSAGRQRWDSDSRWKAHPHSALRQKSQLPPLQSQPPQQQQHQHRTTHLSLANEQSAESMQRGDELTVGTQDVAATSPAQSDVGRLFDPLSTKASGQPRPEAIETTLDDRRDRKVGRTHIRAASSVAAAHNSHSLPSSSPMLVCVGCVSCIALRCLLCPSPVCCHWS